MSFSIFWSTAAVRLYKPQHCSQSFLCVMLITCVCHQCLWFYYINYYISCRFWPNFCFKVFKMNIYPLGPFSNRYRTHFLRFPKKVAVIWYRRCSYYGLIGCRLDRIYVSKNIISKHLCFRY